MANDDFYVTSFCNFPHRMSDGKPIGHECYVIPPRLLKAEREEAPGYMAMWGDWFDGRRVPHRGVRVREPVVHASTGPHLPDFSRMSSDELMAFWKRYTRPTRRDAAALIGDTRPGFTKVAHKLAAYASNLATHKLYPSAQVPLRNMRVGSYLDIANDILGDLPEDIRAEVRRRR